jgi:hypothetical protein
MEDRDGDPKHGGEGPPSGGGPPSRGSPGLPGGGGPPSGDGARGGGGGGLPGGGGPPSLGPNGNLWYNEWQLNHKLHFNLVPKWDGHGKTVIASLCKISELVCLSPQMVTDLGAITPLKFTGRAEMWWTTQSVTVCNYISQSWTLLFKAIKTHFLNDQWLQDWMSEFEEMKFCQHGHEEEMPMDFLQRLPVSWPRGRDCSCRPHPAYCPYSLARRHQLGVLPQPVLTLCSDPTTLRYAHGELEHSRTVAYTRKLLHSSTKVSTRSCC